MLCWLGVVPNLGNMLWQYHQRCPVAVILYRRGGIRGCVACAGRLMERYSDRLISLAADCLVAMRDLQNVKTGQMSVAASQTTGVYLMPPLIGGRLRTQVETQQSRVIDASVLFSYSTPQKLTKSEEETFLISSASRLAQLERGGGPQNASSSSTRGWLCSCKWKTQRGVVLR